MLLLIAIGLLVTNQGVLPAKNVAGKFALAHETLLAVIFALRKRSETANFKSACPMV